MNKENASSPIPIEGNPSFPVNEASPYPVQETPLSRVLANNIETSIWYSPRYATFADSEETSDSDDGFTMVTNNKTQRKNNKASQHVLQEPVNKTKKHQQNDYKLEESPKQNRFSLLADLDSNSTFIDDRQSSGNISDNSNVLSNNDQSSQQKEILMDETQEESNEYMLEKYPKQNKLPLPADSKSNSENMSVNDQRSNCFLFSDNNNQVDEMIMNNAQTKSNEYKLEELHMQNTSSLVPKIDSNSALINYRSNFESMSVNYQTSSSSTLSDSNQMKELLVGKAVLSLMANLDLNSTFADNRPNFENMPVDYQQFNSSISSNNNQQKEVLMHKAQTMSNSRYNLAFPPIIVFGKELRDIQNFIDENKTENLDIIIECQLNPNKKQNRIKIFVNDQKMFKKANDYFDKSRITYNYLAPRGHIKMHILLKGLPFDFPVNQIKSELERLVPGIQIYSVSHFSTKKSRAANVELNIHTVTLEFGQDLNSLTANTYLFDRPIKWELLRDNRFAACSECYKASFCIGMNENAEVDKTTGTKPNDEHDTEQNQPLPIPQDAVNDNPTFTEWCALRLSDAK